MNRDWLNAREDLVKFLDGKASVICALIKKGSFEEISIPLKLDHSPEDFENFLSQLNFEYDSGFGGQYLHGYVWLSDGTWLYRGEYDGSEWWEHAVMPPIPDELK